MASGAAENAAEPTPTSLNHGQLAMLPWAKIPTFVPGETNVESYARSVQFLFSLWPPQARESFVTALILKVEGTAMETIMNNQKLFEEKNQESLENLMKILGGSWGKLSLEERFGDFEVCVYQLQQQNDESIDSWISRSNAHWSRLLQKGVTLAEFQAYILLRHSKVNNEDKRKLLVEAGDGLDLDTVRNTLRKLGAKFFGQMTGISTKVSKTYPVNFVNESELEDQADHILATEESLLTEEPIDADDIIEDNVYLSMLADDGDSDAALILGFEGALIEAVQENDELAEAFTSYTEARNRLRQRATSRGFWPIKGGKGLGRGNWSSKGGTGKGKVIKGKGKKQTQWNRQSLADRIANSKCAICHQYGHWKRECPQNTQNRGGQGPEPTALAISEEPGDIDAWRRGDTHHLLNIPELQDDEILEASASETVYMSSSGANGEPFKEATGEELIFTSFDQQVRERFSSGLQSKFSQVLKNQARAHRFEKDDRVSRSERLQQKIQKPYQDQLKASQDKGNTVGPYPRQLKAPSDDQMHETDVLHSVMTDSAFISDISETQFISDTGATRGVAGSEPMSALLSHLPQKNLARVRKIASQLTFRFGNMKTLTSMFAVLIPISHICKTYLRFEIVEGRTPLLFSNKAHRALGALIDTVENTVYFRKLGMKLPLQVTKKELHLIDLLDFYKAEFAMPVSIPTSGNEEVPVCKPFEEASCCETKPDSVINEKPISVFTSVQTDHLDGHSNSSSEFPGRNICQHGRVLGAGTSNLKWRSTRATGTRVLQGLLSSRKGYGPESSFQPEGNHGTVGHA